MKADFYPIKTLALLDGLERDAGLHDPKSDLRRVGLLIERICKLEREKAAILAVLEDDGILERIASGNFIISEEVANTRVNAILSYRLAVKERIGKI